MADSFKFSVRPVRLAGHLKVPRRDSLTGVTYFYLLEHRDDEGVVNVQPLIKLLNERGGREFSGMRQVHRKMDVLKKKHGMFIEKHGKEPYIYRVKPLSESVPKVLVVDTELYDTILNLAARPSAKGDVTPEDATEDCMKRIRSEFRWGFK